MKDVPITMQKFEIEDTFSGSPEDIRTITNTYTFSAQMDFFGPTLVTDAIIKKINISMSTQSLNKNTQPTVIITEAVTPQSASVTDNYTITETITENI